MNKSILLGRLTKDPETKFTATNNVPVSTFTLAVERDFKKQGEEKKADFISIITYNKLAEIASKHLKKGTKIAIEGGIRTSTWDDEKGFRHYKTEVVAEKIEFVESKKDVSIVHDEQKQIIRNEDGFLPLDEEEDDLPF